MSATLDFVKKVLLALRPGLQLAVSNAVDAEQWVASFSEALVSRLSLFAACHY
jgi:hypothetical protein